MKIEKRRRGRRYRWGKGEILLFLYDNCLYHFIFQMMGAIQRIEDLEEKRKKIQKTWRLRREEEEEDIDEVKAKYCCFFMIIVCIIYISDDGCHTTDRRFRREEEEDSEDMKIEKRRRGRRYRWGKGEILLFLYDNCLYNFIFQMMGAIQRIEDLEEKRKKIQKTWRLRREEEEEDIDEVKAKYCCFFMIIVCIILYFRWWVPYNG